MEAVNMEENVTFEPVAIIGLSCRFAGDATDPQKLWSMLADGKTAWGEIPSTRFNIEGAYHPNRDRLGTTHVRGGHFLDEDVGLFDARFFNLSTEAASSLDPQIRLQLESVYEALENAGLTLAQIEGSNTAVYAGSFLHDYSDSLMRDQHSLPRSWLTGNGVAMASNRISHFFDFRGASMTLDTGCSSTLIALHQAVQCLQAKEASMSIVAGSNLLLNTDAFNSMGSIGLLSPDGRSYSFDSRANGYGRGEGAATVVLKRLKDVVASNDAIRAIIRSTAVNQDGRTEAITSPSQGAQEKLIRECYRKARIDPLDTHYFEAHGTGTRTGDLVEIQAISAVFQKRQSPTQALRIGSIKPNIGHTEATSGLASLIKVVLALENSAIPPNANFETPNPKLNLQDKELKVLTELEPWPTSSQSKRLASINSFGYGGSNAHAIIEQGPQRESPGIAETGSFQLPTANGDDHELSIDRMNESKLLVLTAKEEGSCQSMIEKLKQYLEQHKSAYSPVFFDRLIYTLGNRRSKFDWIAAYPVPKAKGIDGLVEILDSPHFTPTLAPSVPPRVGFVFTGQGAQWFSMGRELITEYPVFQDSLRESEKHLRALGADWWLLAELDRDVTTTRINETIISIPSCVALQIALVSLLRSWGVLPAAVTSHSSGEIAAAYALGIVDHRTALAIAYYRGAVVADTSLCMPGVSGMIAVGLGQDDAQDFLDTFTTRDEATVACINSPSSVTISGNNDVLEAIEVKAKAMGYFTRRLKVDHGFHSAHMKPATGAYREHMIRVFDDNDFGQVSDSVIFSSPVLGARIFDSSEINNAEHWVESLVRPVEFMNAFIDMVLDNEHDSGRSIDVVIEIGPHTTLGGPIKQILELPELTDYDLPYMGCLERGMNALDTMQRLATDLLRKGLPVNLSAVNFPRGVSKYITPLTDLPSYAWNHQTRYWSEPRVSKATRDRAQSPHYLLGFEVSDTNPSLHAWKNTFRLADVPWFADHAVQSSPVFPGAGYICMITEAMKRLAAVQGVAQETIGRCHPISITAYRFQDVDIAQALVIPDSINGIDVRTDIWPAEAKIQGIDGWMRFEVSSVTADGLWICHARGSVMAESDTSARQTIAAKASIDFLRSNTRRIDPDDLFTGLRSVGIQHGPKFRNLDSILQDGEGRRSVTTFHIADTSLPRSPLDTSLIHPTTLDSIFVAAYASINGIESGMSSAQVPRTIKSLWISSRISNQTGRVFKAHAEIHQHNLTNIEGDIEVMDHKTSHVQGVATPLVKIGGLKFQSLDSNGSSASSSSPWIKELCMKLTWVPDMAFASPELKSFVESSLNTTTPPDEADQIRNLWRVCIYFIQDALNTITDAQAATFTTPCAKYYAWMQHQLHSSNTGNLSPGLASQTWTSDPPSTRQTLIRTLASTSITGELLQHVGPHIPSILRGDIVPIDLLTMENSNILHRYYESSPKLLRSTSLAAKLLQQILATKSPFARILEIGAGTGCATRAMLKVLGTPEMPSASLYHYTDISAGFFARPRTEFEAWGGILRFDRLDIEVDPAAQGFELGSYDVVIACEVLHATRRIGETVGNVRGLLKDDGQLLLVETTEDRLENGFVFGLLPGWWLGEGEEGREWSPGLGVEGWERVLRSEGFTGVDYHCMDCEDEGVGSVSVIVSTAVAARKRPSGSSELLVITSIRSPPPDAWVEKLRACLAEDGDSIEVCQLLQGEEASPSPFVGKNCIFLGEITEALLEDLDETTFRAIKTMATKCKGLLWVTRGGAVECENPSFALAPGFLRSLRNEYVGRRYMTLDLDPRSPAWSDANAAMIARIASTRLEQMFDGLYQSDTSPIDYEYAVRDGIVLVPRFGKDLARNERLSTSLLDFGSTSVQPLQQADRALRLRGVPDRPDTVVFDDDEPVERCSEKIPDDEIEIAPRAYGLDSADILAITQQSKDGESWFECAGLITRLGRQAAEEGFVVGHRVFGLSNGLFASPVRVKWTNIMHVPEDMEFEDAVKLPVAACAAFMTLVEISRLQQGQSVLIHSASGAVGETAIQLAQHIGAEVFVTVNSAQESNVMIQIHGIPADHVIDTAGRRPLCPAILSATQGRGVDVVLNSSVGSALQECYSVIARFGCLIDLSGSRSEAKIVLDSECNRNVSFSTFDLTDRIKYQPLVVHRVLSEASHLIKSKVLKPVFPATKMSLENITDALSRCQNGKLTGKIVITISPDEMVPVLPQRMQATFSPHHSYLLVGGLGHIGRSIACWMAARNAKHLVVISRRAETHEMLPTLSAELQRLGCTIKAISCDASNFADLSTALETYENDGFPPILGVVQAAMAPQDSVLEHMTWTQFKTTVDSKARSSKNLDSFFTGKTLDFFILLSSVIGILGNSSQSNYAAGGSFQDALACSRVARGLPAVSVDLAAIKLVGKFNATGSVKARLEQVGQRLLSEGQMLLLVESAILAPFEPQIVTGINLGPGRHWETGISQLGRDARFMPLQYRRPKRQQVSSEGHPGTVSSLADEVREATSRTDILRLVQRAVSRKLAQIFSVDVGVVDLSKSPGSYGIDSLVAVDMRNLLAVADISIFDIMQSSSLSALMELVSDRIARINGL